MRDSEKIGGTDIVTEIDESKFAKGKYNVGHRVQGGWVFGSRKKDDREIGGGHILKSRLDLRICPPPISLSSFSLWKYQINTI